MLEGKTEAEARQEILALVSEYCDTYHAKKEYQEGDRIPYASRVYDHDEMVNLVDSSLEFWLTAGRYTDEFEKKFAEYQLRLICKPECLYGSDLSASWRTSYQTR